MSLLRALINYFDDIAIEKKLKKESKSKQRIALLSLRLAQEVNNSNLLGPDETLRRINVDVWERGYLDSVNKKSRTIKTSVMNEELSTITTSTF